MGASEHQLTAEERRAVAAAVTIQRIVVIAMILGSVIFAVIAVVVAGDRGGDGNAIVYWGALAVTAMGIVMSQFLAVVTNPPRPADATIRDEIGLAFTRLIAGMAPLEGAAFLDVVAYIVTGRATLLIAAAVLVVFMAAKMPSQARLSGWIESRRQLAELEGTE